MQGIPAAKITNCDFLLKCFTHIRTLRIFALPEPAKPLNDAQMCGSFFYML